MGEGIAGVLEALLATGTSPMLEALRADTPAGIYDLMRIEGLGARRIRTLYAELGIDSLDAAEAAAAEGRIAALPGFGAKTEAKILEGAAYVRTLRGRRRWYRAAEAAGALLELVEGLPGVVRASSAGELRRRLEVVESVDLVAASTDPAATLAAFRALQGGDEGGAGIARTRMIDGVRLTLRAVDDEAFATALLYATGNEAHLEALRERAAARRLRLAPEGLFRGKKRVATADEASVYTALELAFVPPELREGWGEVEAAAEGRLPELVETADLRGTFHCHTTASDGRATLAEMAEAARARGWRYLGIADHSQAAGYAGGLSPAAVRKQQREIDAWNREHGGRGKGRFRLLKGIEADILADGSLDYDDAVLATFDYVVGSVHSGFGMGEREMTDRLLRAVGNPRLTILGHATGRLLLRRSGYAVDVRAVVDAAAEHGVAVEINADPSRLDVDWRTARYAAERGVLVPINPDAHSAAALGNVAYGVNVARKGWLTKRQVPNAWELEPLEE